jgi:hypothetical protein
VESETNGLVDLLTTLATVEERFLEAVNNWKQYTTGCIGRSVDTVGARNSASQGSCMRLIRPKLRPTEYMRDIPLVPPTEIATVTIASVTRRDLNNIAVKVQRVVRERMRMRMKMPHFSPT